MSVLLAGMALIRAFTYWLDRYALSYSTDGKFAGLGYTDAKARLPVLDLLILIALLSVVLFVVNIRRKGWGLPAVAVGSMGAGFDRHGWHLPDCCAAILG